LRFAQKYVDSAASIVQQYDGGIPFSAWLKQFFAADKKYGSRDRKIISHLCYCHYRLGNALTGIPVTEKILIALFLCSTVHDAILEALRPDWAGSIAQPVEEKISILNLPPEAPTAIFSWKDSLSEGIDAKQFILSHLIQPDLFLRIRPGKEAMVLRQLQDNQVVFRQVSGTCLALPNASKIDTIVHTDKDVIIQDYSSQRIAEFLQLVKEALPVASGSIKVWDCCAASGGKSILAWDVLQRIQLTVSDVRSSILHNLKERFVRAGIKDYHSFVADVSNQQPATGNRQFDLIICDAPCSGSGTWGRTPEQLLFFTTPKISQYAALQKSIVKNTIHHLAPGGYFLYITCSVFRQENEEVVAFIQEQFPALQLIQQRLLTGYDQKADSMFAALWKAPGHR